MMHILQTCRTQATIMFYRVAYFAATCIWFVIRPRTTGVRIAIIREQCVLMVRHSYGNRSVWQLPGGGIQRAEQPAKAAERETLEEVGLTISAEPITTVVTHEDFRECTVHGFLGTTPHAQLIVDPIEIAQIRWFPLTDLPQNIQPSSQKILAALGSQQPTQSNSVSGIRSSSSASD